ncbi:hypothetical protein Tco_0335379 [Tanacetum coccineum]
MGRGPYQLVHVKFEISSWHGARVDVRTYLLGGAIDGSEANAIIRDPKLELEGEMYDMRRVHGDDVAKTVFLGYVMDTLNFMAMPFGLTNAPAVFKELMIRVIRKDDRGVTERREDVRKVFQQRGSKAKRKLSRCGRNQMGNEPILAFPEGADNFVVYYDARSKDLEACLEKREKVIACTSRQPKVLMKDCMTNVMLYRGVGRRSEAKNEFEIDVRRSDIEIENGSYWLDKVQTSIWRDVRTLAIEEAYTTKYSIHSGADTMLCGFKVNYRWLSMEQGYS